jgi:hypothetical protein
MHVTYLASLLKCRSVWTSDSAFLASYQVRPTLLVCGSHTLSEAQGQNSTR